MNRLVRRSAIFATLAVLGCTRNAAAPRAPLHLVPAVAADQPGAQAIGEAVLADGGSAADAAVATLLALGVENPSSSGLGGGGFAVIWEASANRAYSVDFRESAPAGVSMDHYRTPDGVIDPERSRLGCYAVGVPGEAAGLEAIHQRFGHLAWDRLVRPAQKMAAEGVPVSPYLASAIQGSASKLERAPALRALLAPDGKWLRAGDTFRNEDLSNTLGTLAHDGASAFYRGTLAASIAATCRDAEGSVGQADLTAYHPIWRAPIVARWNGYDVLTVPPPSSGGAVLVEMLHILEPANFDRNGPEAAQSYHLLVEAMKHGFADRATQFGDPDFTDVPVDELTSTAYAERLRAQIDGARTRPHGFYGHPGVHTTQEDHGTTNVSVVDAAGNAIAITSSVNDEFGAMIVAPQTGVVLNDTLDDFSFEGTANVYGLIGSEKNRIQKGKRPVSSMTPTILLKDKEVRLVVGASGGPRITSATLQTILGVLAEGKDVDDAVDAPRVHHQWSPDVLRMEPQIPQVIADDLAKRGHTLEAATFLGAVTAVEVKNGKAIGAADPRKLHPASIAEVAPPPAKKPAPGPTKTPTSVPAATPNKKPAK